MTSRLTRLSVIDRAALMILIAATSAVLFPQRAAAYTENKTAIVFEIKNLKILNPAEIAGLINGESKTEVKIETPVVTPKPTIQKVSYNLPAKAVGDARVYMHEPEIRAYICPKLGDKCNIFIAVLAAENGTHECTRDNRGLNRNGSVDIGLAQINWRPGSPYTFEQLQDCKFNLDVALSMYQRRGFQPWYAYTKGAYLRHLPAVLATANVVAQPVVELVN